MDQSIFIPTTVITVLYKILREIKVLKSTESQRVEAWAGGWVGRKMGYMITTALSTLGRRMYRPRIWP